MMGRPSPLPAPKTICRPREVLGGRGGFIHVPWQAHGLRFPQCVAETLQFYARQKSLAAMLTKPLHAASRIAVLSNDAMARPERVHGTHHGKHPIGLEGARPK